MSIASTMRRHLASPCLKNPGSSFEKTSATRASTTTRTPRFLLVFTPSGSSRASAARTLPSVLAPCLYASPYSTNFPASPLKIFDAGIVSDPSGSSDQSLRSSFAPGVVSRLSLDACATRRRISHSA